MAEEPRNSAHELLRLVAMFLIVWYHLISYYLYLIPHSAKYDSFLEASLPSLHIGVILFVLISGYWGIKPSIKGFSKLLAITAILYLPLELMQCATGGGNLVKTLMFITNTPYWFIRTYLFLYLISPILNTFLKNTHQSKINIVLAAMSIICRYFGTTRGDPSRNDGKNITNFMFLYLLGKTIHNYKSKWENIPKIAIISCILVLNATIFFLLLYYNRNTTAGTFLWSISMPYCSPLLIINASLVFILFSQLHLNSKLVNNLAKSVFAVYLIHCQPTIHNLIILPTIEKISQKAFSHSFYEFSGGIGLCKVLVFSYTAASALIIMTGCIIFNKSLIPIWLLGEKIYNLFYKKFLEK